MQQNRTHDLLYKRPAQFYVPTSPTKKQKLKTKISEFVSRKMVLIGPALTSAHSTQKSISAVVSPIETEAETTKWFLNARVAWWDKPFPSIQDPN
jgi:hypothetical protein